MKQDETYLLLRECNAGIKTAVNSIEAVMPKVRDEELADLLDDYLTTHEKLGDEVHSALKARGWQGKPPSAMARMMAGGMIAMKYAMHPNDETIADLMADGCAMGVRKVTHRRNRCARASGEAQLLAQRLVQTECEMMDRMSPYL